MERKKGGASRFYPVHSLRWYLSIFDPYLPRGWGHSKIAEWHTGKRIPAREARWAFEYSKIGVIENVRNTVYMFVVPPTMNWLWLGSFWFCWKWFLFFRYGPYLIPWLIEQAAVAPMRLLVYFMGGLAGPNTWCVCVSSRRGPRRARARPRRYRK